MEYKYNDYIRKVSSRFNAHLDEIAAYYNFDLGNEYEIAICKALRATLPERFGICRGFVVTAEGKKQAMTSLFTRGTVSPFYVYFMTTTIV